MLHRSLSLFIVVVLVSWPDSAPAESPQQFTQPLWPGPAPGAPSGADVAEGDTPELIFRLVKSDAPTAAVVILPGGGYHAHAIDHEGYQFAEWFASMGVSSAICTYRHRGKGNNGEGYGHPQPMNDAQRAIQTLRAHADQWNIDPDRIGVIGFSAGGHLCSTVSTKFQDGDPTSEDPVARVSSRPDFAILCYPVIAFDQSHTHKGSQRNLLGANPDAELIESLSNERQVSSKTPPTFLFHTAADKAVPSDNSLHYYLACLANGVEAELHIFPEGRHGLGLAQSQPGANQWPSLCRSWLQRIEVVEPK